MKEIIRYWQAIFGGIGIALIAGTFFAQTLMQSIAAFIVGLLSILVGNSLAKIASDKG